VPSGNGPREVEQLFCHNDVCGKVKSLLFLFIGLGAFHSFGQLPPGVIDRFSTRTIGNRVQIEVTLSAGYTCNGIVITRSVDSLLFETIGLIGGVCGDSAAAVSYSFTDSFPPTNKQLHYQLLLGGRIATDTRQVIVYDFQSRPIILLPNPTKDWVEVRFDAAFGSSETLLVLDGTGRQVAQFPVEDGYARFSVSHLATGNYFICSLQQPGRMEKLLVVK